MYFNFICKSICSESLQVSIKVEIAKPFFPDGNLQLICSKPYMTPLFHIYFICINNYVRKFLGDRSLEVILAYCVSQSCQNILRNKFKSRSLFKMKKDSWQSAAMELQLQNNTDFIAIVVNYIWRYLREAQAKLWTLK